MRVGIAHHLGWAVAVTASEAHEVVDRRRIELVEPGMAMAPVHHEGKALDDAAAAALIAQVRVSAARATSTALDELATAIREPIVSMSLRAWPVDFPTDIEVVRRVPYEARADSVMYREVLAELARARGWDRPSLRRQGRRAPSRERPRGAGRRGAPRPRARLGPPWGKDHRMALAATIIAGGASGRHGDATPS